MFTVYLNLSNAEFSASRLCLLQFAAALSCVEAINKTPQHEVNIYIKGTKIYFIKRLLTAF
jgi:hypothetical protein